MKHRPALEPDLTACQLQLDSGEYRPPLDVLHSWLRKLGLQSAPLWVTREGGWHEEKGLFHFRGETMLHICPEV